MEIKIPLPLFLILCCGMAFGQNPEEWQSIEFETAEDYKANEDKVLECAHFVLSMPAEAGNPARQSAMGLLAKWVTGTPDHTFIIDESLAKLMNKNDAILSLYMASVTRYVLENEDNASDQDEVKLHAFDYLLTYCEEPGNKVPMTRELKKAIKAKNSGHLKEYLTP